MGRPAIGKLPNSGTWVAIFGNGFNSSAGTANLYVVRLSDGVILQVIPTNSSYTGNGLGAIEIVRKTSGSADTIEYVYGADFRGASGALI
jgi:type IV pilus assembly protein PilY1